MTTAIVQPRRSWLPALNLVLAGGAAVLGVIAITSDDVSSITPAPAPQPVVVVPAADEPSVGRLVIGAVDDACGKPVRGRDTPC
jgi:hypothetical protein